MRAQPSVINRFVDYYASLDRQPVPSLAGLYDEHAVLVDPFGEHTAGDIEGVAKGQTAGNAFNWHYSMNVKASGRTWLLNFDDWMYLQDANHLFNKTEMKKFGLTVGTVTLFFSRKTH